VVDAIRRDGRPAADRWVRAVKAGGTLPPLELMRLAGVDMTSSEPIHRAVELFGRLIDELEGSFPEERAAPVR
jgi:oligoendopeptidase F